MKSILSIILLTFLLQSCNEIKFQNGGNFKAENNDLFYALWINSEMDSIKIYVLEQWSSDILKETITEKQNYEMSISGTIDLKENEIFITELESTFPPTERPKLNNLEIRNGKIYLDCENITEYVWGRTDIGSCKTEKIEFSRMEK